MRFYFDSSLGTIGNSYVRTTRFVQIGGGTSGTVTLPTNSTVVLDDFGGTTDAVVVQISGGRPKYASAVDSTGQVVATTFDSGGNWVFTAAPVAYPVAILYRVKQTLVNHDSTSSDIVGGLEYDPSGAFNYKRTVTATSYTVLTTDEYVGVTSTAAARTITLPTAASAQPGKVYLIKDESLACSVNNITIDGDSSETIDGALTYIMNIDGECVGLISNGSNWFVV